MKLLKQKCELKLERLEAQQTAGDFSAETARAINLLRGRVEVLANRVSGLFTKGDSYKADIEISIPKAPRK